MALRGGTRFAVRFEDVFPAGCALVPEPLGEVEDYDEKTGRRSPAKDKLTGQRVWQVRVMDLDPELGKRSRETMVKICRPREDRIPLGRLVLAGTAPRTGSHWTDDGGSHERRGLKHRGRQETRTVPIQPRLVELLCAHVDNHGVGPDGWFFPGLHGGPLSESVYDRWWKCGRRRAPGPGGQDRSDCRGLSATGGAGPTCRYRR